MPYIDPNRRQAFDSAAVELGACINTAGELNYALSKIVHTYLERRQRSYEHYNTVIGVLDCAKLELYRQLVSPYEDDKKRMNGPVSTLDHTFGSHA